MVGGLFGLFPRWRYFSICLIRRFQILVRIRIRSWSVYGAVFEWRDLLFYGISPFLLLVLTVSYFSIDLIISRHDTRYLDV